MQANTKPILKTNNNHHNNNILTQQLNTYRPKNTNEINNFLQKPQHHNQHSNHNLKDNFLNRQEQHTQRLTQNKTKQENLKEEEMHLIYTFNPKVNNASSNTNNNNQGMYQINQYTTSPIKCVHTHTHTSHKNTYTHHIIWPFYSSKEKQ